MNINMIRVGIVGGTGYTGVELMRLLARHPEAELKVITSRSQAGEAVSDLFPNLRGHVDLAFSEPAVESYRDCDLVFFATPNTTAMGIPNTASSAQLGKPNNRMTSPNATLHTGRY